MMNDGPEAKSDLLETLIDAGGIGIWHWDLRRDRIHCHDSYARLLGWEQFSDMPQKEWLPGIFSPDSQKVKKELLTMVAKGNDYPRMDFRVTHRLSGLRWHSCRGKVIKRSPKGEILKLTFINQDFTRKSLLLEKLKRLERQSQNIFKIIPGMIYRMLLDRRRTNLFVSQQAEEIFGFSDEDAMKYQARGKVHPEDQAQVQQTMNDALENHAPFELVYRAQTMDGEWKWILERGMGVYDEEGKAVEVDGFITDMSHQHQVEAALRKENLFLKSNLRERFRFRDLIGKSQPMHKVYEMISMAAAGQDTVVIYGPSGTGKELAARAIHDVSDRKEGPFIPVNCGAIAETLMEREFFGHAQGAFTGAGEAKQGFLDRACSGTLFLDELGEISLAMQVKLLRILEGHGYTPVGGSTTKKPDIRIIAATNRDLKQSVARGQIREDFYYRIHVLPIHMPALKERREDISLLVEHFLKKYDLPESQTTLPLRIMEKLMAHDWPGNVRELQNVVRRYVIFGELDLPGTDLAPEAEPRILPEPDSADPLPRRLDRLERQMILSCLKKQHWHKGHTAKSLGIDPKTLYRKLKHYGIK